MLVGWLWSGIMQLLGQTIEHPTHTRRSELMYQTERDELHAMGNGGVQVGWL
jgi:hypothetical protein